MTAIIPTTHDALLRAVLLAPHDDQPRLILADWCEENGQEDYAWYIREAIRCERGEVNDPFWQVNHEASRVHRPDLGESGTCLVWRGFVREIHVTHDYFLEHAAEIFAAHPVERVALTGWRPYSWDGGFFWLTPAVPRIDRQPNEDIYEMINEPEDGYVTEQLALDALSAACVALGRERADLPPLTA